jgi:hypothetical protein
MKYLISYVEGCSPKWKAFDTRDEAEQWVGNFVLCNLSCADDNWIDCAIHGELLASRDDEAPLLTRKKKT